MLWSLLSIASATEPPTLSVGHSALTFSLPAINEGIAMETVGNARVALSDFVGALPQHPRKAVVVVFFDRRTVGGELEGLEYLQKRYAGKDVQFLAISTDTGSLGGLATWLEEKKLSYPVLRDNHQIVLERYAITELPLTMVVDGDGYVFAMGRPSGADFDASVEAEILPLLGEARAE